MTSISPTYQSYISDKVPDKIRIVAEEFESVFIAQMFNAMFQGISTDGLTKGGPSERVFRNMIVTEVAKQTAHTQSIGIADAVETQIRALAQGTTDYSQVMKAYEAGQLATESLSQQMHLSTFAVGGK
jgi:Rod binding domain-containing protein